MAFTHIPSSPSESFCRSLAVFVPGCLVEVVGAADVCVWYLCLLCSQKKRSSPLHGYQNTNQQRGDSSSSSSFHVHCSKVLPELVLKELWGNFCVCKTINMALKAGKENPTQQSLTCILSYLTLYRLDVQEVCDSL